MRNKLLAACSILAIFLALGARAAADKIATAVVESSSAARIESFDAVVEAVRQTVLAAQVSGEVVAIDVKVGDAVRAGQILMRIDARAAEQSAAASEAQVQAARASLEVATQEYKRQEQLFRKSYISQAALERAQAQFKATQAQVSAQLAQADVARTQSGFFVVKAPYAGIVAEVPVAIGDMAMPGRPLLTVYDPAVLRVTATVPQTAVAVAAAVQGVKVEVPGAASEQWLYPVRSQVLPTVDPATHTVQVRLELARGTGRLAPGTFARVWLPASRPPPAAQSSAGEAAPATRLFVPSSAVVRRTEMTGLYVLDSNGRPLLRQVRLGPQLNDRVEILAGVAAGERIALEPQAAARVH
ncbi:Efflux transporter, RND family [Burkholderiales bacterium]|nr:Efflux transporter, RND family [Burkholderiales bacterium]